MNRKSILALAAVLPLTLMGNSCDGPSPSNRDAQAEAARRAANSISFTDNAEIENIKRRINLTAHPGAIGFIILLNQAGQPILYEGVSGKVTSGGKRLTPPMRQWAVSPNNQLGPAPSDEGTWGNSADYIFYWNANGEYRQWSGAYLYSDKPLRLRIEPLVVTALPAAPAAPAAK